MVSLQVTMRLLKWGKWWGDGRVLRFFDVRSVFYRCKRTAEMAKPF